MSTSTTLFEIPIPPIENHPGGSIVCTTPRPRVYLLTFSSPPDNRLTTPFCHALLSALDVIEHAHPPGVVITTSAISKFYSNGLDLAHATDTENFWSGALYPLFRRLLTYPMPTVALINGHAFAGGLMTAMHHDYRVMNPSRGFACMNEVIFGAPLKPPMAAIFRAKCDAATFRDVVLEGRRYGGPAARDAGLVDAVGGLDEALDLVQSRNLVDMAKSGVYGLLKMEMWRELLALLETTPEGHAAQEADWSRRAEEEGQRAEKGKRSVEEWAKANKAKL